MRRLALVLALLPLVVPATAAAASVVQAPPVVGQVSEYELGAGTRPTALVAGPDGNLWFVQEGAPKIGRITPRGVITQFAIPTPYGADAIVSGPEGRLWFAAGDLVGAISTGGAISWPAWCSTATNLRRR